MSTTAAAANPGFLKGAIDWFGNTPIGKSASGATGATPLDALMTGAAAMNQPLPAANPMSVYTPEMLQAAIDQLGQFGISLESFYGTPTTAPGSSVTQTQQMSPQQIKAEQYVQYRISQGDTPEQAQAAAQAIVSGKKKFNEDKGFMQAIRSGAFEGLSAKDGRIQAAPKFIGGGVTVDPQSEALTNAMRGLGLESVTGIRNMLSGGYNQQGLLPEQQNSLDAMKARYMDEFSDVYRTSTGNALGELVKLGTTKASYAPEFITDTAGKAQSRFLTQALGELASREESMLQGRANRQNQALQGYTAGIMNPGGAGLFTDPQSAQMAASLMQQNAQNRFGQQAAMNSLLTQPVTLLPAADDEGLLGKAGGALSGAASGAAAGAMFGPVGAGVGGVIGGLGGLFG